MGGDFEALGIWRFHRQDTGVGSRFETAAIGGVLVPGPQNLGGVLKNLHSGPGALAGIVTGIASRSQYVWAGASYQHYAESDRDRKPDVLFYSAVYGYRPRAWRTDTGWDWRIFGEFTGERTGRSRWRASRCVAVGKQMFLGPTTLGVFKNYAVSAVVQFPVYQDVTPTIYPREHARISINFSYFF